MELSDTIIDRSIPDAIFREPLQTGTVVRNLGWTLLALDLESRRRSREESKMGDDVQHGEKDGPVKAPQASGNRGVVS